ncbi:MNN4 [Candida jiufengensis]|uniref:MNN4 n=1 Tax=Candida jiufengensis TaxID=497108 RepID=UPI002225041C|nr:MNN4 [Candida jiufengensis]KAI5954986.1 MNN4 [Candida jiufengensis]
MLLITMSLVISTPSREKLYQYTPSFNDFDKLIYKIYDNKHIQTPLQATTNTDEYISLDPESEFDAKVDEILESKKVKDSNDKYWTLDTNIKEQTNLNIPSYYYDDKESKPELQPFDPRFTLSMYYYYINQQLSQNKQNEKSSKPSSLSRRIQNTNNIKIPFNWYDWIDMSILDNYILAPDELKPDCEILNATYDHKIVHDLQLNATLLRKGWDEAKKKDEEEKKKAEEEKVKAEEDKKKAEEEKHKQEEEAKHKQEEEAKHKQEEEEKHVQEDDKNNQQDKQEETKPESDRENKTEENKAEEKKAEEKSEEKPPNKKRHNHLTKREEELLKNLKDVQPSSEWCLSNSQLSESHNDDHKQHPGFNVFKTPGRTTPQKGKIIGKSYMYSYAPPPSSIIFLTESGSYTVDIDSNLRLLNNQIPEDYIAQTKLKKIDILKEFGKLTKNHPADTNKVMNEYSYTIAESDFDVNCDAIVHEYNKKLENGVILTDKEQRYHESLKYSIYKVANGGPTKYFDEARLLGTDHGDHYDWRFFNGMLLGTTEQTLTLHRLIRAWLSFTRKNGITTWIAHGSLLSWYWNGVAFPWDNDIDVQVPIMDLHKLSLNFNQTLIVEDPKDGFGRYFVDCGTFLSLRERGNGLNTIDARFIDIDTGMYIDITALALSNTKPPDYYLEKLPENFKKDENNWKAANEVLQIYNCRNNHFTPYEDLSPLMKTIVEGEFGYIPKRFSNILSTEYKHGLSSDTFEKHVFIPKLRLWIKEEDLFYYLKDRKKWIQYHTSDNQEDATSYELTTEERLKLKEGKNPYQDQYLFKLTKHQLDKISTFNYDDITDLLLKDEILLAYLTSREFTSFHENEIMKLTWGKNTAELILKQKDFQPLQYEPFLYKLRNEFETFDSRITNLKELTDYFQSGIQFDPFVITETDYGL